MCGISGYLNLSDGVDTHVLQAMTDVIRHRGPDDEGYVLIGKQMELYSGKDTLQELALPSLSEQAGSRAFLGMGHRRLSILDVSANGHQPMLLAQEKLAVVYNGEIYNYQELRDELTAYGYVFRTTCDTEVLLRAYCQWGEECIKRFNGMFAFALWDGRKNRLFCGRDRMGAKPFHYWISTDRFLFGSELKQLCQDNSIPRRFDCAKIANKLAYGWYDYDEHTFIQDFLMLPPAHYMVLQLSADRREISSVKISPYWQLQTEINRVCSLEEWKERVAHEFRRSCLWRLRSDAPLAALLSGGLDSSCIVSEVCGLLESPSQLETFTASYPQGGACDEWEYANMVNQFCGCKGNRIYPTAAEHVESAYEEILWHAEGSAAITILGLKQVLDAVHERGYKVVLNGQCGDETMFGYDWYYARYLMDLIQSGHCFSAIRHAREIHAHSALSYKQLILGAGYYTNRSIREQHKMKAARPLVQEELLNLRQKELYAQKISPASISQLQESGLTSISLPGILRRDDRLYMSVSLESRLPFLDYQFIELAAQIPVEFKIRDGYTKRIMRDIFDGRLPKAIVWRTDKHGFEAPGDKWKRAFSPEYLHSMCENPVTAPFFHLGYLRQQVDRQPSCQDVFIFLETEILARKFKVSCG